MAEDFELEIEPLEVRVKRSAIPWESDDSKTKLTRTGKVSYRPKPCYVRLKNCQLYLGKEPSKSAVTSSSCNNPEIWRTLMRNRVHVDDDGREYKGTPFMCEICFQAGVYLLFIILSI